MRNRVVYNPRERKKYKQPSKIRWKALLAAAILLALTAGVVYTIRLPRFQIGIISISGNQAVNEEIIRGSITDLIQGNYAFILPRSFVLFLQEEEIASALKKDFPLIEHAEVKKQYPDSLAVHITERKLFAIFCNGGVEPKKEISNIGTSSPETAVNAKESGEGEIQCVYIDKNGFAYDTAPRSSGTLITRITASQKELPVPSQVMGGELVKKMEYIAAYLPETIQERVAGFEFIPEIRGEFKVKTRTGFTLLLREEDDPEKMLKILKTVLESEVKDKRKALDYVDLRFGNKVFFKWK
ncbi:MAG: FtsQ-type POTRA domain-containing protein [Candidatus Sungbacteria bacterium]|nr:FtsQ-type POTRA domain-containing protein [Candidatus Sungbacteria bacterium]